jgi:hypothetical protein
MKVLLGILVCPTIVNVRWPFASAPWETHLPTVAELGGRCDALDTSRIVKSTASPLQLARRNHTDSFQFGILTCHAIHSSTCDVICF